jgi:hypothetical protein
MKTRFQSILFLFFTGFLLISCGDKNYYNCDDLESRRIVLSSRVTMETQPRLQDLQIEDGQSLSLFITPNNAINELLYSNVNIIANGIGGFAGENMYYPIDGRNVDFFAIHPYSSTANLTNPVNFSVASDQTDKSNYLNSDLLHATRVNQPRTPSPVAMVFSHKLAKLDFTIENNDGLDLGTLNTVTVLNTLPGTTINMINGNITEATGNPVVINAYGVAGSPETRASVTNIHAIVIPQTVAGNTDLFRITIGQQTYVYTTNQPFTFEGGYQHAIKLTITAGEISLESSIRPWEDGASIGGEVRPE